MKDKQLQCVTVFIIIQSEYHSTHFMLLYSHYSVSFLWGSLIRAFCHLASSLTNRITRKAKNNGTSGKAQENSNVSISFSSNLILDTYKMSSLGNRQKKKISESSSALCHFIISPPLSRVGLLASFELTLRIICHQQFYKLIRKKTV